MFLLCLFFAAFVAFPKTKDAILENTKKSDINIEVSGSLGLFHYDGNKCIQTYGNETLIEDEKQDWCSTITNDDEKPFIQYSINNKKLKVSKYSIRNGCCYYDCCCPDGENKADNNVCCCELFSYSLIASNDKRSWITLHKVSKDNNFYHCLTKTFDIENNENSYTYYRFVLDEQYPNSEKCLQLNQVEFYGEKIDQKYEYDDESNDDESISIIGRVSRKN